MRILLDASAAVAAVLAHPKSPFVLDALERASIVIAPDLYVAEVGNALWKYVSAGEVSPDSAAEGLSAALDLVERFVPADSIIQEALLEATTHKHPVYDLCYAIAARREGCSILTLDTRLQRLARSMKLPIVRAQ